MLVLACLFICSTSASGQSAVLDRVGAIFDDLGRGLDLLGKKATDLVGPGLGLGEQPRMKFAESREFNERYPVNPSPVVSVSNEFGGIRIDTWNNPVVEVSAEILVGADTAGVAGEIARGTEIRVDAASDRVTVNTLLPDTRRTTGKVAVTVNLTLTVPEKADLIAENYFGDVLVHDLDGTATVNVQYGMVELANIEDRVTVRMRGEFALEARELADGGTFDLNGAHGRFNTIGGNLKISNFRGTVEFRDLAENLQMDVNNEGGTVVLYLDEQSSPDFVATSMFGNIKSDIELSRSSQGDLTIARSPNIESNQHIAIRATFGDVLIKRQGARADAATDTFSDSQSPVKRLVTERATVDEDTELFIDAVVGDVQVSGVDEEHVRITATQWLRIADKDMAEATMNALDLDVEKEPSRLVVRTRVLDDMKALGCSAYRIDLAIQCPRTCPIDLRAQNGHTTVDGTGGHVHIEQMEGSVVVEHAKGALELTNRKGGVYVKQCAGPVQVTALYGTVHLEEVYGKSAVNCEEGKTIIDALHGPGIVRHRGGDVRLIALETVSGSLDIQVENGNLSVLLPLSADIALDVTAEGGMVYSAIPLNGAISQEVQEFHGRLNKATHEVVLHVKGGDIRIN